MFEYEFKFLVKIHSCYQKKKKKRNRMTKNGYVEKNEEKKELKN